MSENFQTILIIGATSGIGEGLARRFHAQGKKVIITGRRQDRLDALTHELPGLSAHQMDTSNLPHLPTHITTLLTSHPTINTIITMAGIQSSLSFTTPSTTSPQSIATEVTTNLTAPMIIAHLTIPHLLSLPDPSTFILVSSGLAFLPVPLYPVYCPTKAGIHSFAVALRAQLGETRCRVVELAPPYVDTGLDAKHREAVKELQGGEEKAVKPMGLEKYLDTAMEGLREGKVEVTTGFSEMVAGVWRGAFGPVMEGLGIKG
ncbi:MAG: hypothetical protein Q9176_006219 [Flavoplaca citrina]